MEYDMKYTVVRMTPETHAILKAGLLKEQQRTGDPLLNLTRYLDKIVREAEKK
jgi:hypothetical protein